MRQQVTSCEAGNKTNTGAQLPLCSLFFYFSTVQDYSAWSGVPHIQKESSSAVEPIWKCSELHPEVCLLDDYKSSQVDIKDKPWLW